MVQLASYLRRVLCKTRLTVPHINGPISSGTQTNKLALINENLL